MSAITSTSTASSFDTTAMFRSILVPINYDDASQRALAAALELRRRFGGAVHLYHFAEPDESARFLAGTGAGAPAGLVSQAEKRLRSFMHNVLPDQEEDISVHATVGADMVDAIAEEAARVNATLVIAGRDSDRHMLRSRAERMVQRLHCPVLLMSDPTEKGAAAEKASDAAPEPPVTRVIDITPSGVATRGRPR